MKNLTGGYKDIHGNMIDAEKLIYIGDSTDDVDDSLFGCECYEVVGGVNHGRVVNLNIHLKECQ